MGETIRTRCCIAGGGPAGMMAGFLLARMGVEVQILEKHPDFLRDFRGDTVHPSTLQLMYELGALEEFLKRPHQEIRLLVGQVGTDKIKLADFTHVPAHCQFLALMPQWDFLNFIVGRARPYPGFHLRMQTEAKDLIRENGQVAGVIAKTAAGDLEIRADLTIAADGRSSVLRERAGLPVTDLGAPMDVMWMRLSHHPGDPQQTFGYVGAGKILVMLDRHEYWQCAFVIPKGAADTIRQRGLPQFRAELVELAPFLSDRVNELKDWNDIAMLSVAVNRLTQWAIPGLLCIGDAAHAMSPIGGVGINLAIQDAVATANLLGAKLLQGAPTQAELDRVQRRRMFPTRATQKLQTVVQNHVIRRVLGSSKPPSLPLVMKPFNWWPVLRRIPARMVGIGFRPEHIRTPDVLRNTNRQ